MNQEMMGAATIDRYGPPEVFKLGRVPKPAPASNEVLVRILNTVATPPDCAFRSANPAMIRLFAGLTRPRITILGDTFAGVIESIGAGVTRYKAGDRVYGATGPALGAYAQYVAVPEDGAMVTVPEGTSASTAVALADGWLTALPFIRDEGRVQRGQSALVNGAAGGIGSIAVQIARHYGAIVTGVCGARNLELVKSLGADRVIDYGREDFTATRDAYDVIFDAVGKSSFAKCRAALRPGGIYLTTVPTLDIALDMLLRARGTGKRARLATTGLRPAADKRKDLLLLNEFIARREIVPVIDRSFALAQIVEAHRYVETGHKRGSCVIDVEREERPQIPVPAGTASRLL